MDKKVAIVTGGTSGIGRATALALQSDGYTVYELSRRAEGMADVRHIVADITREETLRASLAPWLTLDVPLDREDGALCAAFGTVGIAVTAILSETPTASS